MVKIKHPSLEVELGSSRTVLTNPCLRQPVVPLSHHHQLGTCSSKAFLKWQSE